MREKESVKSGFLGIPVSGWGRGEVSGGEEARGKMVNASERKAKCKIINRDIFSFGHFPKIDVVQEADCVLRVL